MGAMIQAAIATVVIALILGVSEILWRTMHIKGEFARKFVHIIAGTFIAFLPFWVSYEWVAVLAIGFIIANLINRYTPIFHAINGVKRRSIGDVLFGVGILVCALAEPNKWIFASAILQVALADGLAALVGTKYSKHRYKIFDTYKSPIGTFTYFLSSAAVAIFILLVGNLGGHNVLAVVFFVPLIMASLENVSGYGTDNIVLPVGFLLAMHAFSI